MRIYRSSFYSSILPWVFLGAIILFLRLALVQAYPGQIGDAGVYLAVALNILHNGCVSLSAPDGAACVPHWGGNQLPGYPAFIAAVWTVFGETNTAVRVIQALVSSAALLYLAWSAALWSKSRNVGLIVGLVLALSPATMGWPRHMFTESLAIAASAWVFAEIIRSLADKRLRMLPLGLGLAMAVFIRIDLLSLCIPIALAGFMIERPAQALSKGFMIAIILALPVTAWTVRSAAVGLPSMPNLTMTSKGVPFPAGFMAWGNTWAVNQYQLGIWMYPVMQQRYRDIAAPAEAMDNPTEAKRTKALLADLAKFNGKPMPAEINAEFAAIAAERAARSPVRQWLVLPLKRIAAMWLNPASSTGLPLAEEILGPDDIKDANRRVRLLSVKGFSELFDLAIKHPKLLFYKGISFAERIALAIISVPFFIRWMRRPDEAGNILFLALSFSVARLVTFAYFGVPTTRYIVEGVPLLEIAVILVAVKFRQQNAYS